MGYVIRMPQMGMTMDEGTVLEWYVGEGDVVEDEEPIAFIESEKTTSDVEAREAGEIGRLLVAEGTTVEPGDPIGILVQPDEDVEEYAADIDVPRTSTDSTEATTSKPEPEPSTGSTQEPSERPRATPGARKRAEEIGVDLTAIEGTGPQGVITEDDVEAHAEEAEPLAGASVTVAESSPLSSTQETIARRLGESYRDAVHVTLRRTFDATTLQSVREAADGAGLSVSISDLIIEATAAALERHPAFNAHFVDDEHRLIEEINIAVAVDIDRGLITPVIPGVSEKPIEEIQRVRRDRTSQVQSDEFSYDILEGGTFTISNLGMFGIDSFDPVINPPQVAILGVGRIREDDTLTVTITFDHRVVNGADAARFLDSFVEAATDASYLLENFDTDLPPVGGRAEETREIQVRSGAGLSGSYRVAESEIAFDEPTDMGGSGLAPTPVEHLLGALGSCLTLSVRAMGERDDIEIGEITSEVTGIPNHGPLETVHVELTIDSDAASEDLDRVVTKAERACYVERALAADVHIETEWRHA